MKHILKQSAVLSILSVLFITLIISVFAHPGSLDENGGHWNHKTGEYHYHAGTHTDGSNSSNSTTRYYYDFEEFEDYPTSNFNNSVNNSTKEESTTNNNIQTTKDSVFDTIGDVIGYVFICIAAIIVFGKPIVYFVGFIYYIFIEPIFEHIKKFIKLIKTKHKKSTKVSIEAHEQERIVLPVKQPNNETTEQNIANSIPQHNNTSSEQKEPPPQKQQTKCKTKSYEIKRDKIFDELVLFSLSDLAGNLPVNIEFNHDLELIYKSDKSYEKYSVFVEPKSFVIHRKSDCGPAKKQKKLSLDFSIDSKYLLCPDCWTEKQKTDSINLFMPQWYSKYKTFRKHLEKYDFSVKKLMVRKQLNLYRQFTASEHKKWKTEIHTDFSQMKKIYKAKSVKILSYDHETKKAKIQGSKGEIYTTTFTSCSCKDFSLHHLPCKHIYKYFAEYGGIDFSKYI